MIKAFRYIDQFLTGWCRRYQVDSPASFLRALWQVWRQAAPMIVFMVVYYISFIFIEEADRPHYTEMHTWIDDVIPFCEIFIIPYLLWFFYMVLSCVYFYLADRQTYMNVAKLLCFGMTVFIALSIVFPNIQYLRPTVMPRDNVFTRMIAHLYEADTPTNLVPSIHVYNTLCVLYGVRRCRHSFMRNIQVRRAMNLLGILIILSTMFIKQHSVIDVTCAFATVYAAQRILHIAQRPHGALRRRRIARVH